MPGMTLKIPKESEKHKKFVEELSTRIQMAEKALTNQEAKWDKAERNVNAYVPASSDDLIRETKRDSYGMPQYTTIKIPYTYALLMAAHTYWTSVFFARAPVHQFSGRHGESETAVQALEAVIDYQVKVGEMLAPYYLWLYDAGKYGIGILGTHWDEEVRNYSILDANGEDYITRQVKGYRGNRNYNVSPREFLPDPRVPVNQFQRGEFCAVARRMSWNDLKRRESRKYYTNIEHIKKGIARKRTSTANDEVAALPESAVDIGSQGAKHPAWVDLYEVYIELIPDEWGLGAMKWPEKWVFTITADFETIIGAQPLGAIHDKYPFDVFEPEPEAYSLYNRGIPEIIEPLQNTIDWLVNSHFYNVRALANGRFIADPSKIDLSQLEEGEPGWIAALRPEAWGQVTDIRQVFHQVNTSDPTQMHLSDMQMVFQLGEKTTGINDQILGALSGGRKTATEVRSATGFGVNRLKTASEYMSATGFAIHVQKLIQNTQQYLEESLKVKIVGDLAKYGGTQFVAVDAETIAGSFDFVPVDGTLPVDRFAQAALWKDILGQIVRVPQIMQQYDLGKVFAYIALLGGVKNIDQFRLNVQVAPDDQLAQQAQAGNVVPMIAGPGPQSTSIGAQTIGAVG